MKKRGRPGKAQLEFAERPVAGILQAGIPRQFECAAPAPQRTARGFCWLSMVYPGPSGATHPAASSAATPQRHHQKQPAHEFERAKTL